MPKFGWKEEYSLGLPEMDEQHREIFSRLADLEQVVGQGSTGEHPVDVVEEVRKHSVFHFGNEERMLGAIGFPGLVQQRVQHRLFVNRLRAIERSLAGEETRLTLEQVHSLQSWIMGHVVGLDREYADFLEARGGAAE